MTFQLSNSIRTWLAARKATKDERFIIGSEKIAGVALPIYYSKQFVTQENDKTILLIGDASMSVPYFRTLNAGLIGANHAAKLIANMPLPAPKKTLLSYSQYQPENWSGELLAYQNHLTNLAHAEITSALKTNFKVNVGQKASYISQHLLLPSSMSVMDDDLLFNIQQARLDKPNIIARHPRFTVALGAWAAATTLCATILSISLTYLIPISLSVLTLICAIKLAYQFYEASVIPPKPEFAWEQEVIKKNTDIEMQRAPSPQHGFFQDGKNEYADWYIPNGNAETPCLDPTLGE